MSGSSGTFTVLHTFSGLPPDYGRPNGDLIDVGNVLYGYTYSLAAPCYGSVFAYTISTGKMSEVYSWQGNNDVPGVTGGKPNGSLVWVNAHNLFYGVCAQGGSGANENTRQSGPGLIFSLSKAGVCTTLYDFATAQKQYFPSGVLYSAGNLIGVAFDWNHNNADVIWEFNTSTNSYSVLHTFGSGMDGYTPLRPAMVSGVLYGVCQEGGANGYGNVWSFNLTTKVYTNLHDFDGDNGNNQAPSDVPIVFNGTIYGCTTNTFGQVATGGTIWSLPITGGTLTILGNLPTGANYSGENPLGRLIVNGSTLYGTTAAGGTAGEGTLFSLPLAGGTPTVLHNFSGVSDGQWPNCGPVIVGGVLYGTSNYEGSAPNQSGPGDLWSYVL